jgi:hypothetical protein
VAFVAAGSFNSTGVSATLPLTAPSFTYNGSAGQVLFAFCGTQDDAPTIATPSGWNLIFTDNYDSVSRDTRLGLFYRVAQSGDSAASWNFVKSANDFAIFGGFIWLSDGIDTASILDATAITAGEAVSTSTTLPAFDPTSSAGQLFHIAWHTAAGAANTDYTTTPPASSTVRFDAGVGATGAGAMTMAMADRTHDGTAIGSSSWGSGPSETVIGVTFAVNNSGGGGGGTTIVRQMLQNGLFVGRRAA